MLQFNNVKTRAAMNVKNLVFLFELKQSYIYYKLHNCTIKFHIYAEN